MYYTVYKITNNINGKIYVGVHKTDNLDDNYMGSGKVINRAIQKHGIENFTKEYIAIFDNINDMFDLESHIVNESFVNNEDTYNIKVGGLGGFDFVNKHKLNSYPNKLEKDLKKLELAKQRRLLLESDTVWRQQTSKKVSDGLKEYFRTNDGHFKGKTHTTETKEKLKGPRPQSARENNSQYGTIWITDGFLNKKIKKYEIIPIGWYKGRK